MSDSHGSYTLWIDKSDAELDALVRERGEDEAALVRQVLMDLASHYRGGIVEREYRRNADQVYVAIKRYREMRDGSKDSIAVKELIEAARSALIGLENGNSIPIIISVLKSGLSKFPEGRS